MRKVVAFFPAHADAAAVDNELTTRDITNFHSIDVSSDFEEQIRQEILLTSREGHITILSAFLGALAGVLMVAFLLNNREFGQVLSPFLANTIYSTLFSGAGMGFAAGGLLGGLYALSRPLPQDFSGYTMLVIYSKPEIVRETKEIVKKFEGITL